MTHFRCDSVFQCKREVFSRCTRLSPCLTPAWEQRGRKRLQNKEVDSPTVPKAAALNIYKHSFSTLALLSTGCVVHSPMKALDFSEWAPCYTDCWLCSAWSVGSEQMGSQCTNPLQTAQGLPGPYLGPKAPSEWSSQCAWSCPGAGASLR